MGIWVNTGKSGYIVFSQSSFWELIHPEDGILFAHFLGKAGLFVDVSGSGFIPTQKKKFSAASN